jgi:hypothetical protein
VPTITEEERKIEDLAERTFNNIVIVQNQLIANKTQKIDDLLAKIGLLKNQIQKDFNFSWGQKIQQLLSQFASSSEQIVKGYDDLKNEIGLLRGQIKILQDKLEGKMEYQHKEVLMNITALQKD